MRIKIYADVLFAVNLFMDFMILWITSRLWRYKVRLRSLFFGATIMALSYVLLVLVQPLYDLFYGFWGMQSTLLLGIFIAFHPKQVRELLYLVLLAEISAFIMGGVAMALFFLLQQNTGSLFHLSTKHFSFKLLLVSSSIAFVLFKAGENWMNANIVNKGMFLGVEVYFRGKSVKATALVDTGHSLKDPFSKEGVIIVELSVLASLFTWQECQILYGADMQNTAQVFEQILGTELSTRLRLIPFKSLGKDTGLLLALRCPLVKIIFPKGDQKWINDAIVGLYNGSLSNNKGYDALINTEVYGSKGEVEL